MIYIETIVVLHHFAVKHFVSCIPFPPELAFPQFFICHSSVLFAIFLYSLSSFRIICHSSAFFVILQLNEVMFWTMELFVWILDIPSSNVTLHQTQWYSTKEDVFVRNRMSGSRNCSAFSLNWQFSRKRCDLISSFMRRVNEWTTKCLVRRFVWTGV